MAKRNRPPAAPLRKLSAEIKDQRVFTHNLGKKLYRSEQAARRGWAKAVYYRAVQDCLEADDYDSETFDSDAFLGRLLRDTQLQEALEILKQADNDEDEDEDEVKVEDDAG